MRNVKLQHIDFRWVWSKVLPQVYDDSLSYYEQLCKLGATLDTLATQCEEYFTEIYALIEIINDEIARLKERMDAAEGNIADLMERTGVLREDVDSLLGLVPDITAMEGKVAHLEGGNVGEVLAKHSSTDFDFEWKVVRGVPSYGSANEGQLLSVIYDGSSTELEWVDPPTDIPAYYVSDDGKVLKIGLDGNGDPVMYWGLGLPELDAQGGDANKILAVNGSGNGIEWKVQEGTIPAYGNSDIGKALCVNNDASGVEWVDKQDELPAYTLDESFYVLSVNNTGTGVFWQNNKVLGVEAFEGSGAPSGTLKAKTGDLYRDVTTNSLYWCVRYVDPDNITSLLGLGVEFNETIDLSPLFDNTGSNEYFIDFKSGNTDWNIIDAYNNIPYLPYMTYKGTGSGGGASVVYNPNAAGWMFAWGKTITDISGGTDVENTRLIQWFAANGTFTNLGSQWVKLI